MASINIEPGTRYNNLIVIEQADDYISPKGAHAKRYKCRCDCGNIIITRGAWLKCGKTKSCPDCSHKRAREKTIRDLTGQRFGRWTVIERAKSDKVGVYWKCKCDCGNIGIIRGTSLTSGNSISCGCFSKEKLRALRLLDLRGQRFGRLTVLEQVDDFISPVNGKHRSRWKCKCDCGNITFVSGSDLTSGMTRSCGCYKADITSETHFEDLSGQRFGMLVVLQRAEDYITPDNGRRRPQFLCQCDCGNIKVIQKDSLMNGTISCGCINSRGEREISEFLRQNFIPFEIQYSFPDLVGEGNVPLHFDFAIKNKSGQLLALVEYQGEQHYDSVKFFGGEQKFEKQKNNDNRKRTYCINHNIELIEIPYWDKIENYLSKFVK